MDVGAGRPILFAAFVAVFIVIWAGISSFRSSLEEVITARLPRLMHDRILATYLKFHDPTQAVYQSPLFQSTLVISYLKNFLGLFQSFSSLVLASMFLAVLGPLQFSINLPSFSTPALQSQAYLIPLLHFTLPAINIPTIHVRSLSLKAWYLPCLAAFFSFFSLLGSRRPVASLIQERASLFTPTDSYLVYLEKLLLGQAGAAAQFECSYRNFLPSLLAKYHRQLRQEQYSGKTKSVSLTRISNRLADFITVVGRILWWHVLGLWYAGGCMWTVNEYRLGRITPPIFMLLNSLLTAMALSLLKAFDSIRGMEMTMIQGRVTAVIYLSVTIKPF